MLPLLYIALYVFYTGVFLWLIFRVKLFDIPGVKKTHLAFFFLLKVVAGIGLTLIYTYYYTDKTKADIYRYFTDSKIISSLLFTHPLAWLKTITGIGIFDADNFGYVKDTLYMSHPSGDIITSNTFLIRIISLLNYFSFGNIYIDTLLLNCLMFAALTAVLKELQPYFKAFPQILYWPLFLMPSVVFWSAGLLKEGLLLSGLMFCLSFKLQRFYNRNPKVIIAALAGAILVGLVKIYVFIILGLCTVFAPRVYRKPYWFYRLIHFAFYIALATFIFYNFSDYMLYKRNEFIQLSLAERSGSLLNSVQTGYSYHDLISLIPSAFVNSVARPFLWDKGPVFQFIFAVGNFVFLISLLVLLLFYFKRPASGNTWLVLFFFFFAMLNYLVIGITVPVLGAIVHYRVIAMPFLLMSVLLMTDLDKLKLHLTRLVR